MVTNFGYFDSQGGANKQFADYQGNIRATIAANINATVQTSDYYPYGLPLATSTGAHTNRYKYSANELETRDGINLHNFDARLLLSDLGYMNRPDPKAGEYPMFNPYLYCAANPIKYIDPSGETIIAYDGDRRIWFGYRNGDLVVTDDDGNQIAPESLSIANQNLYEALQALMQTMTASSILRSLILDSKALLITVDKGSYNWFNPNLSIVNWTPGDTSGGLSYDYMRGTFLTDREPDIGLFHELVHVNGTFNQNIWHSYSDFFKTESIPYSELTACYYENCLRGEWNAPIRIAYDYVTIGSTYFTYSPLPIYVISSYWISKILNSK